VTPKETVEKFLHEMLDWEDWYAAQIKLPEYHQSKEAQELIRQQSDEKMRPIMLKFLAEEAFETIGMLTIISKAVSRPRRYKQIVREDFEIKGKKAYVYTDSTRDLGFTHRFTLKQEGDQWKILSHHTAYNDEDWKKTKGI